MAHLLLSPLTWALLLALLLCLTWRQLGKPLRVAGIVLEAALLLLCTPLGANALVRYVESRTPAQALCAPDVSPMPIVLLSAGYDWDPAVNDDYVALAPESWRRLRGAIALWQRNPGSELVIAGGGPFATKESTVLARLAQDWGVPAAALRTETRSTTTWESAFALRGTLPARVRLVSSALHLPRALVAFRAAGFAACAYPNDSDYQPPGSWGYYVPQSSSLTKAELALHELAGTAIYAWRARREHETASP